MPHEKLVAYVRDHLTAARNSQEMLAYLEEHALDPEIRSAAARFSAEAEADREVLEYLAGELRRGRGTQITEARWRKPRRTRRISVKDDGPVPQLTALEGVALGLLGRIALWDVLIAMTARDPSLPRLDYRGLRSRAREQHGKIEAYRLRFAVHSLPAVLA